MRSNSLCCGRLECSTACPLGYLLLGADGAPAIKSLWPHVESDVQASTFPTIERAATMAAALHLQSYAFRPIWPRPADESAERETL